MLRWCYLLIAYTVQYAKSQARFFRWKEEESLLLRELERAVAYFKYRSGWWLQQAKLRQTQAVRLAAGLAAYANRQSHLYHSLALQAESMQKAALVETDDSEGDSMDLDIP